MDSAVKNIVRAFAIAALTSLTGLTPRAASGQAPTGQRPASSGLDYVRSEAMIPVRDGVSLHTVMLRPAGSERAGPALPFLMERTPYGVDGNTPERVKRSEPELAASGYIFVYQDIRGRYGSGGQFVMNRPVVTHRSKGRCGRTTDTRDSIDWLLKNVPNNSGKVGVTGVSYPGFLAVMAGVDAHPAVKAISPQAPMTDVWMGDDFFHNGAFRETYGFDYVQQLEAQKTDARVSSKQDQYEFFLSHMNFAGARGGGGNDELADLATVPERADVHEVLAEHGRGASFERGRRCRRSRWAGVGPGRPLGTAGRVCGVAVEREAG